MSIKKHESNARKGAKPVGTRAKVGVRKTARGGVEKKMVRKSAEKKAGWWKVFFKEPEALSKKEAQTKHLKRWRVLFNQIIILFVLGCVFGTYWEEIMHLVTSFWATGVPEWESRRGLVYGPFSPVYGIGAVLIYLLFYRTRLKGWVCFVGGAVFGGVLEFTLSVLQEWIFGTISWDYSGRLLNIDGRTTIPFMIVWGALVWVFTQWVYPFIDHAYHKMEEYQVNRICIAMAVFLAFDISMSVAAAWRQVERHDGDPADTTVEVFLDKRFPDERLDKIWSTTHEAE